MNSSPFVVVTPEELSELIRRAVVVALLEQRQHVTPALLDRAGIAQRLGTSPSTVDRLRREGMPVVWLCDSPRFEADACLAWLREHCRPKVERAAE